MTELRHEESSLAVFRRVASQELSPSEGASILLGRRQRLHKPVWMPCWVHAGILAIVGTIALPFRDSRRW